MSIETDAERRAQAELWGDRATAGGLTIGGQYDEPQAEELLVEGYAPTFLALREDLYAAAITTRSVLDTITTADGRTLGPFTVISWAREDDGVFIRLGLEAA